jgi:hypothetical protein
MVRPRVRERWRASVAEGTMEYYRCVRAMRREAEQSFGGALGGAGRGDALAIERKISNERRNRGLFSWFDLIPPWPIPLVYVDKTSHQNSY